MSSVSEGVRKPAERRTNGLWWGAVALLFFASAQMGLIRGRYLLGAETAASTSPSVSALQYADIRKVADRRRQDEITDVQWKTFYRQHQGKKVRWSGWVDDVVESIDGGPNVHVDMEPPSEVMSSYDVSFGVSAEVALDLQIDQKMAFVGRVEKIRLMLGADLVIFLEDAAIEPSGTVRDVTETATEGEIGPVQEFYRLRDLLEEKRAEISRKSEWYDESADTLKALRSQEDALQRQVQRAALAAAETLQAELKAIESAWKEGQRKGLKPGHPEMRKLSKARREAERKFRPVWFYTTDRDLTLDLGDGVTMKLVLIPPGEFMMGSPPSEDGWYDDEEQHRVRISKPFYMSTTEVTQEQYEAVMGENPSVLKYLDRPVYSVSWYDAQDFCQKLTARTGQQIRLPTEAEWEYACRAGTETAFSFGDNEDELGDYAWYDDNSGGRKHAVGGKRPNPWGLYDMHGNVWEWCADYYDSDYYDESPTADPEGPSYGGDRVSRGGSWDDGPWWCGSAFRNAGNPSSTLLGYGFRVVCSPKP